MRPSKRISPRRANRRKTMPNSDPQSRAAPSVNPDLKAVHEELIAYARDLDAAVGRASTSAEVNKILDEINEVTARIVSVGRQLFAKQTTEIKAASVDVFVAAAEAKKALDEIENIKGF